MARAIIRLSVQYRSGLGSRTNGRVKTALRRHGFRSLGRTGTWECPDGTMDTLLGSVEELSQILRETDAAPIDHLWVYIDQPRP